MTTPITDAMRFFMNPMWPAAGAVAAGTALTSPDAEAGMRDVATRTLRKGVRASRGAAAAVPTTARRMATDVVLSPEEEAAIAHAVVEASRTHKQVSLLDALDSARAWKARHPADGPDPWQAVSIKGMKIDVPSGRGPVKYKPVPETFKYNYDVDPATGQRVTRGTPQFARMSDGVYNELMDIWRRAQAGDKQAQAVMDELGWYKNVGRRLEAEYGSFSDAFADLLGATSPKTKVLINFKWSRELLQRLQRGDFDNVIETAANKLDEIARLEQRSSAYLQQAKAAGVKVKNAENHARYTGMQQRIDVLKRELSDMKIMQEGGEKEYGINSNNALIAVADRWRVYRMGDAPKAKNFAGNFTGRSLAATIDRWAARNLRRHAGLDRLPVESERGISGKIIDPVNRISNLEFGVGQEVLDDVTRRFNASTGLNLDPRDTQALQWFAEKELWKKNGWSVRDDPSIERLMDTVPTESGVVGISRTGSKRGAWDERQREMGDEIVRTAGEDPDVFAAKAPTTQGLYGGKPERSFDVDIVSNEDYVPTSTLDLIARRAVADNQDSFFYARRIGDEVAWEKPELFNVGAELKFKDPVAIDDPLIQNSLEYLQDKGIAGFTLIVDPRVRPGAMPDKVVGLRFLDVPQYYDAERFATMAPEDYATHVRQTFNDYTQIADDLAKQSKGRVLSTGASYWDVNVKRGREAADYLAQRADPSRDPDALSQSMWGFKPAISRFREFAGVSRPYYLEVPPAASGAEAAGTGAGGAAQAGFAAPELLAGLAAGGVAGAAGLPYLEQITDFAERRLGNDKPYKRAMLDEALSMARSGIDWASSGWNRQNLAEGVSRGFLTATAENLDPQAANLNRLALVAALARGESPLSAMMTERAEPNTNPISDYYWRRAQARQPQGFGGAVAGMVPYMVPPFSYQQ